MYINVELCKKCGGKCCKFYPGIAIPSDFGNTKEEILNNLTEAFKSGLWTIDWLNRKNEEYFVRPAIKGKEFLIFDHSISGECVFLNTNGCKLDESNRPSGCLLLEPRDGEKCIQHLSKKEAINQWNKYKNILFEAAAKAENLGEDFDI